MTAAVEDYVHAGYDLTPRHPAGESDGTPEEVEEKAASSAGAHRAAAPAASRSLRRAGAAPALLVRAQERLPASGRISPDYMCMDGPSRASAWPTSCAPSPRWSEIRHAAANVFHAGDGNLHPLILFMHRTRTSRAASCSAPTSRDQRGDGGTITGEHGVGVEKLNR